MYLATIIHGHQQAVRTESFFFVLSSIVDKLLLEVVCGLVTFLRVISTCWF